MRIAVFVSGRGTNLQAILNSKGLKNKIVVAAVFSDKQNCPAFSIAEDHDIPTFSLGMGEDSISFEELECFLKDLSIDLIVLAGFLKLIPANVIKAFENKIINIHPALLPKFGGQGMFGLNVHKAVFQSSDKISGATVHFVNEEYDKGLIIAQEKVDISNAFSPEEIASTVLYAEHKILPFVIGKFAEGNVKIENNKVVIS